LRSSQLLTVASNTCGKAHLPPLLCFPSGWGTPGRLSGKGSDHTKGSADTLYFVKGRGLNPTYRAYSFRFNSPEKIKVFNKSKLLKQKKRNHKINISNKNKTTNHIRYTIKLKRYTTE